MKVDGKCHCGAIAYEAQIDPGTVVVCHCTDCQILSGAPYRASAPARSADFRITRGTPRIYEKTAESGNRRHLAFCANCGTALYGSAAESRPAVYILRVGAMRQRAELEPKKQIWTKSALDWVPPLTGLESCDAQPTPKK